MPRDINEIIVEELLSDLSPREKSIIAHMEGPDIDILEACLDRYAEGKGSSLKNGKGILRRVWSRLYGSHRMKVVN